MSLAQKKEVISLSTKTEKCVVVIDEDLPVGLAANTAAILGISLGKRCPALVGSDVRDKDGRLHTGVIETPVPILKASSDALAALYAAACGTLTVLDFSALAQSCRTYDEFIQRMAATHTDGLHTIGLALLGPKKQINALTGHLPLLG